MDELEHLWIEIVQDSSLSELVYNDTIQAGDSHKIWNSATDETLRRIISSINSKMSNALSREYGLVTLCRFIDEVDPRRLVAIYEGLVSALHLSLKSLDLDTSHQFLATILPHCRRVPELNQVVLTNVVPKVLSAFCDPLRKLEPTSAELSLVKVCLEKYHGPCGNQRMNLEKKLVAILEECRDENLLNLVAQIFPLLSSAGGGGSNGIGHSTDWKGMVIKILAKMEDCLLTLFSDVCPVITTEVLFETSISRLDLSVCQEKNVFLRMTTFKNRLLRLSAVTERYLRDPFPAPKPVPMKTILNVVRKMLILDPISILKSAGTPPKEHIYLSMIIPPIRNAGYSLLQSLALSVGSNILTVASDLEEFTLQELKWMGERPDAFMNLKLGLLEFMMTYLDISHNEIGNPKTALAWTNHLIPHIQIKRKSVELNQNSQRRKNSGKKGFKAPSNQEFRSSVLGSSEADEIIASNSKIATSAIKILARILPSLDPRTHKMVTCLIGRTAFEVIEAESFPSPYDDVVCRKSLFGSICSLLLNPIPMSPVPLSFFGNLLGKMELDVQCFSAAHEMKSIFERIVHPICPAMYFPTLLFPEREESEIQNNVIENQADQDGESEMVSSFCQTEEIYQEKENGNQFSNRSGEQDLESSVRRVVESTMQKFLQQAKLNFLNNEEDVDSNSSFEASPRAVQINVEQRKELTFVQNGTGTSKRNHTDISLDSSIPSISMKEREETFTNSPKRTKVEIEGKETDELDVDVMLHDFIDLPPAVK